MSRTYAFLAAMIPAWAYALIRYVLVGTTPPAQIPAWLTNKALAMAAVILLGMSLVSRNPQTRRNAGAMSLWVMVLHALLSLLLLSPTYYKKFFLPDGTLTLPMELSLLSGALGAVLMARLRLRLGKEKWGLDQARVVQWVLGTTIIHTTAMGFAGWFKPATWPGGLPPITLLSCLAAVLALGLSRRYLSSLAEA